MEESDFITRHHIDSLTPCNDPSTFELLNRYRHPPVEPRPRQGPPQQFAGSFPVAVQGNSNEVMLGHMIGQLQGTLQNQNQSQKSNFDGFSMNVNSDIFKWVILFIFLALLVWVVFKIQKNNNPEDKRLKRIERQLRKLRRFSRKKKNPQPIQEEDDLLAFDDPFDDFDDYDDSDPDSAPDTFDEDVEELDLLED